MGYRLTSDSAFWLERGKRWLPRIGRLLTLVGVILLGATAARLTWLVLDPGWSETDAPADPGGAREVAQVQQATEGERPAGLSAVADHHLFGEPSPEGAEPHDVAPEELPETERDLRLRGVLAASAEDSDGRAIIESGEAEDLYRVGDAVGEHLTVEYIHSARVVLRDGDDLEVLALEQSGWEAEGATVAAAEPLARPHPIGPAENGSVQEGEEPVADRDDQALARHQVEAMRTQYERDPRALMEIFAVRPVMEGGTVEGVRLSARDEEGAEILEGSGLREGDVIRRVENVPIRDQRRLEALAEQIDRVSTLDVEVERDGETETLQVELY